MHRTTQNHHSSSNSTQGQIELMDRLRVHAEQYSSQSKQTYIAMVDVFSDLEIPDDQQRQEVADVMTAALGAWKSALANLHARQQAVRDSIEAQLASIQSIKEELGAGGAGADAADLQRLQANRSAHRTLRAWEVDVLSKASYWEQARRARLVEYEDLQARIKLLRACVGLAPEPPCIERPDITASNMEFLKLELERLATEKERREDLLRKQLDDLAALCHDLGEDVKAAVTEVHPHLICLWDADAARVLRDVYRLGSSYSSSISGALDLSDTTISRLASKLTILRDLKASRGAHATEVLSVLNSLWDATDVPQQERTHFVRMMSGPLRLHAASLEKCMAEVRRLEDVRYQQMVDLVLHKGAELQGLCAASHVAQPAGLEQALAEMRATTTTCTDEEGVGGMVLERNPGAAAELLAKLLHMLAEVQVLTAKRGSIIAAINEVEGARQEDVWLAAYEADDQRYKGRDANKKLQRAIRAGKLRERLPAMIDELRALLAEWRDCEGEAFLFDGRDYEFEVLDGLAAAVEEAAAARAAKAPARSSTKDSNSRRTSLAGGSTGGGSPGNSSSGVNSSSGSSNRRMSMAGGGSSSTTTPLRKSFAATGSSSASNTNASSSSGRVGAAGAGGGAAIPPRPASAAAGHNSSSSMSMSSSSPAPRRVGGPSTPMPLRGVSHCSLRDRHSICVVRDREPAAAGPASLSRSGEVRLTHGGGSQRGSSSTSAAGRRSSGIGTGGNSSSSSSPQKALSKSAAAAAAVSLRRSSSEGLGSPAGHRGVGSIGPFAAGAFSAAAGGAADINSGTNSFKTPPPGQIRRLSRDAHASTPPPTSSAAAGGGGSGSAASRTATPASATGTNSSSCKRLSTSSKLNSIFSRSSVQHPVATLSLAAEASGGPTDTGAGAAADQDCC